MSEIPTGEASKQPGKTDIIQENPTSRPSLLDRARKNKWLVGSAVGLPIISMLAACGSERPYNPDALANQSAASVAMRGAFNQFGERILSFPIPTTPGKVQVEQGVIPQGGKAESEDGTTIEPHDFSLPTAIGVRVLSGETPSGKRWTAFVASDANDGQDATPTWGDYPNQQSMLAALGIQVTGERGEEIVGNAETGTLEVKNVPGMTDGIYSDAPSGDQQQLTTNALVEAGQAAEALLSELIPNLTSSGTNGS